MSLFNKIALAALMTIVPMAGAHAADAIAVPTSAPLAAEVPVYDDDQFDWTGFYAGVYGVVQNSTTGGFQYGLGLEAGANAQFDFYLLGAEVAVHGLTGGAGNTTYGQVLARGGVIVTDDIAIYAAGGYGIDLGAPAEDHWLLGGGVEMAVAENVSLKAQYLHGFPNTGANPMDQVTIGANFHF